MPNYKLEKFPDATAVARAAAEEWCMAISGATGPFTVALSGGRIANEFFKALVESGRGNRGLQHARFFWADERCVPPGDPESNYRAARERLFDPLGISDSHVHRIRGEEEPHRGAAVASEELLAVATKKEAMPVFDWVFLGMGEDGHVASLFPGAPPCDGIYCHVIGPKPPPRRITVSYRILSLARQVWVLVSGAGKEGALRASMASGGTTPLARVLQSRVGTRIFSDLAT
jgi:6-phosphogluconolactonase